jgi:hypothetical protein
LRLSRPRLRRPSRLTSTPICSIRRSIVETSLSRGTLLRCSGSDDSRLAQRIGRAAFLAPEMAISPASRRAALDQQLIHALHSTLRGLRLHRQGVQLAAVEMLRRTSFDPLLALHAVLADELG